MICNNCDQDIALCECPDAAERIERLLNEGSKFLFIGPEYRARIEAHLRDLKRRGPTQTASE